MGLIKVATIEGDAGPDNGAARGNSAQNILEAADATEQFGGHVEFGARHFQEWKCAGGPKGNADDASLLIGIDGEGRGARAS